MNELQRQVYLSSLGIDSYMPRWHLPFAAESIACELPTVFQAPEVNSTANIHSDQASTIIQESPQTKSNVLGSLIETNFLSKPVPKKAPISAASILQSLTKATTTIEPFSLSVWRPCDGLMVIDSRNTSMALPTELLMRNVLMALMPSVALNLKEDVLRWPMIENSFVKRTEEDACIELQTWLSVQSEIRPFTHIWLMGENAARYFMPTDVVWSKAQFTQEKLLGLSINALILPSLIELLRSSLLKRNLLTCIKRYHAS